MFQPQSFECQWKLTKQKSPKIKGAQLQDLSKFQVALENLEIPIGGGTIPLKVRPGWTWRDYTFEIET